MTNYFTLASSDNSKRKRFRVMANGYSHILDKKQSIDTTIDGQVDVSSGSVQQRYVFVVRARYEEPSDGDIYTDDWGTIDDLRWFYSLNQPNAVPNNRILFTNHYGWSETVIMAGDFNSQVQGIMIDGQTAWFVVNCIFMVLP
jgi:hypothetical protein